MNAPDTTDAAQIDELLRQSSLRVEQQRMHIAELVDHQAILAEAILTEMLASIDQLTKYRAKLQIRSPGGKDNALLQSNFDLRA